MTIFDFLNGKSGVSLRIVLNSNHNYILTQPYVKPT